MGGVSEGRLTRLAQAEGLSLGRDQLQALLRCPRGREVRARLVALRRAQASGPRPEGWLCRLAAWEAGGEDPWLDLGARLGLEQRDCLGQHELLVDLVRRTLERCLKQDLRASPAALPASEGAWVSLVERLCLEAEPLALQQAQRRLLQHRSPAQLRHFSRVWPEGEALEPLRRAYLAALGALAPELPVEASVVGFLQVKLQGQPERVAGLVDWETVQAQQARGQRGAGDGQLPLRCGLRLPAAGAERPIASCFSAFELVEHEHLEPPLSAEEAREPAVETPSEEVDLLPLPALLTGVDRLLLVLGRATLGRERSGDGSWLPPLAEGAAEGPGPAQRAELMACAEELRPALSPLLLPPGFEPGALPRLAALAPELAPRCPAVAEAWRALEGAGGTAAWRSLFFALGLARWQQGLRLLVAALAEAPGERGFRPALERWLSLPAPPAPPPGRRRGGGGGEEEQGFGLDLLSREADIRLWQLCCACSPRSLELLCWGLNEWELACSLAELLALRAVPGGIARARGSSVWVHHSLLDRPDRNLVAFKQVVSAEGRVPWSLVEVDEALRLLPVPRAGSAPLRRLALSRLSELPERAWAPARLWDGTQRSLRWLAELIAPQPGPEPRP